MRKLALLAGSLAAANVAVWWYSTRDLGRMIQREIRDELHRRDVADVRALVSEHITD